MQKIDRLFEVIQILRAAHAPLTAAAIAARLEVSRRTVYRDIAALQAMRTPIFGEAGIGYVLHKSYDLPPLNFDVSEAEAISVGLAMIARSGDAALLAAAQSAARKLCTTTPACDYLIASSWRTEAPEHADPAQLRGAIRRCEKLALSYSDAQQSTSQRIVWPLALIYYAEALVLVTWCELRGDFRHFRLDRMVSCAPLATRFTRHAARLRALWQASQTSQPAAPMP